MSIHDTSDRPYESPSPHLRSELAAALVSRLGADPELRRLIDLLGRWLVECAASAETPVPRSAEAPADPRPLPSADPLPAAIQPQGPASPAPPAEPAPAATEQASGAVVEPARPEQLASLVARFAGIAVSPILADASVRPRPTPLVAARANIVDLAQVGARLELKADACLWAAKRLEEAAAGRGFDPVRSEYERLRERADSSQPCFLWMIQQEAISIASEDWKCLEGCYRACAQVVKAIVEFPDAYYESPDLLKLLGETQSAIRAAMTACGASPRWLDADQQAVFDWCRREGEVRRVFNPYLALDRLADPSLHGGMLARARQARDDLKVRSNAEKRRRRGLNTVRYHLDHLAEGDGEPGHHWRRIVEGVDDVLASGAAPSLPELVELLVPLADDVPEDLLARPGLMQVLDFVDQRIAASERDELEQALPARVVGADVRRVRECLRGSRVVLIGGSQRPHSRDLLEREFDLAALEWLESRPHSSLSAFEPAIAKADTRLVILMIRWSSHSYEGVQEICRRYAKAFVRLPGGYNPSQVAHQIVAQIPDRLDEWSTSV